MSWVTKDGRHEGYVAAVVPDGRLAAAYTADGVVVDVGQPTELTVPDADVVAWQTACSCGWRGRRFARVADPADHDPAQGRVYLAPGEPPFAMADIERIGRWDWERQHVEPAARLDPVRAAAADYARAKQALADAVHAARAAGATWAEIGGATGMTRQSAQQRWGRPGARADHTTTREEA
jgi:hypothetical protein